MTKDTIKVDIFNPQESQGLANFLIRKVSCHASFWRISAPESETTQRVSSGTLLSVTFVEQLGVIVIVVGIKSRKILKLLKDIRKRTWKIGIKDIQRV